MIIFYYKLGRNIYKFKVTIIYSKNICHEFNIKILRGIHAIIRILAHMLDIPCAISAIYLQVSAGTLLKGKFSSAFKNVTICMIRLFVLQLDGDPSKITKIENNGICRGRKIIKFVIFN